MAHVLFDGEQKIGVIEDWRAEETPAQFKTVLGKTFQTEASTDSCSFTSPKPVNRRSRLRVVVDSKTEYRLDRLNIKGGTHVVAKIVEIRELKASKS